MQNTGNAFFTVEVTWWKYLRIQTWRTWNITCWACSDRTLNFNAETPVLILNIIIYEHYSYLVSNLVVFKLQVLAGAQECPDVLKTFLLWHRFLLYLESATSGHIRTQLIYMTKYLNISSLFLNTRSSSHLGYCAWF